MRTSVALLICISVKYASAKLRVGHLQVSSIEERVLGVCANQTVFDLFTLPACDKYNGLEAMAAFHFTHNVDYVIGTDCISEAATISRLAYRWQMPFFTTTQLSPLEREKSTIVMKPYSDFSIAATIEAIAHFVKWRQVAIVHTPEQLPRALEIGNYFKNSTINIILVVDTTSSDCVDSLLKQARACVFLGPVDGFLDFVKLLSNSTTRPDEFSFFVFVQNSMSPRVFYERTASTLMETDSRRNRKLIRSIYFVQTPQSARKESEQFAFDHDFQLSAEFSEVLALCDALQLIEKVVTKRQWNESRTAVLKKMKGQSLSGYSGETYISPDGECLSAYEIHWFSSQTDTTAVFMKPQKRTCNSEGFCSHMKFLSHPRTVTWRASIPPDLPVCDFDGSNCSGDHIFMSALVVVAVLSFPLSLAWYLQRKEHRLQKMPWRIPFETISFQEDEVVSPSEGTEGTTTNRRISEATSTYSMFTPILGDVCGTARVLNQKVRLQCFTQRRPILFTRKEMELLNTGLQYLHNSSIKFHGALFMSNCVVDAYWVVKLTDFGIRPMIRERVKQKELCDEPFNVDELPLKFLQLAPELLHELKETRERPLGSVHGDIYQMGMLIYQILFHEIPFSERRETPQELLCLIQEVTTSADPILPKVPQTGHYTTRLLSIMQQCWQHRPTTRPTLPKIFEAIIREFGAETKGTLIDSMVAMVDEYSQRLEEIVETRTREIEELSAKSERLLYQIMPKTVADELREGRAVRPQMHSATSMIFCDVCDFTAICEQSIPIQIITMLNALYSEFDAILTGFHAFKIENVGDAYLAVSGIPPLPDNQHLAEVCRIAIRFQHFVKNKYVLPHRPEYKLQIKVGIHSGPLASGILGSSAPRFCVFGDTVNMASRMASSCTPGRIQVSEPAGHIIQDKLTNFKLEERGVIQIKGKGNITTFFLVGES